MSYAVQDIFKNWAPSIWLTLSIAVTAAIYLRGWLLIRRTRRAQFTSMRLTSFFAGLVILWLAIASPLDGFADVLLSAHMVEHLLLMSVVPPLLLLGLPVVPLLRGLPEALRPHIVGPLLRVPSFRNVGRRLVTPVISWFAMNVTFIAWHLPTAFDFALRNEGWHAIEHLCFLSTSILFWWPIVRPWPADSNRNSWTVLIYLVSADVVNTLLAAFLAFCNRPVYGYYIDHPNPFGASPLDDQVLGAAIMWVIGSLSFIVPAMLLTVRMLRPSRLLS